MLVKLTQNKLKVGLKMYFLTYLLVMFDKRIEDFSLGIAESFTGCERHWNASSSGE